MKAKTIRRWYLTHKWTSLICTLFLLNLCLTGLPLVFGEEIEEWLDPPGPFEQLPANTPMISLDHVAGTAVQRYPDQKLNFVVIDDDAPQIIVTMAPTSNAVDKQRHSMYFDSRTGKLLKDNPPIAAQSLSFMRTMLSLHRDLFLELPGALFVGLMGLLFVAAIVSGVVLYGPFMKKLDFGTVRYERSKRLKWLDLHNLLGIVTAAWLLVVGVTGVMNELSTPLFGLWQRTDVSKMLLSYKGRSIPDQQHLSSLQAAYDTACKAAPGMKINSIILPGYQFGSPYHYLLWSHGDKPLTSRLFTPILVDATSGSLSASVTMPAYLRSIEVSRPLHFGNYGGLPLKVLWAVFDIVAIIVLASGLYLWFVKRKSRDEWLKQILQTETTA